MMATVVPSAMGLLTHVLFRQPSHDLCVMLDERLEHLYVARHLFPRPSLARQFLYVIGNQFVTASLFVLVEHLSTTHWWILDEC